MKKIVGFIIILILMVVWGSKSSKADENRVYRFLLEGTYQTTSECLPENKHSIIFYKDGILEIAENDTFTLYKYEKHPNYEYNRLVNVKNENDEILFSTEFKDEQLFFPFKYDNIIRVCKLNKVYNIPINPHYHSE